MQFEYFTRSVQLSLLKEQDGHQTNVFRRSRCLANVLWFLLRLLNDIFLEILVRRRRSNPLSTLFGGRAQPFSMVLIKISLSLQILASPFNFHGLKWKCWNALDKKPTATHLFGHTVPIQVGLT